VRRKSNSKPRGPRKEKQTI